MRERKERERERDREREREREGGRDKERAREREKKQESGETDQKKVREPPSLHAQSMRTPCTNYAQIKNVRRGEQRKQGENREPKKRGDLKEKWCEKKSN